MGQVLDRIGIGGTRSDRVRLTDWVHADRLHDKVSELLALIRGRQISLIRRIEAEEDVEVAVGLLADGVDHA